MAERSGTADESAGESDFDAFFRLEQPKMVALAIALTGVPEAARDIAQDSLVKAYRAWPSVRVMDKPGAWLRRVTINDSISWNRRTKRERAAAARLGTRAAETPAEVESEHFWRAVRGLPDRQRASIALYYLEDLSIADVASTLGIAEGTVKATLSQARASLAKSLGVAHEREEQ